MLRGNLETQQAATQKLMEAAIYLRRAADALMAVQGVCSESADRSTIQSDRKQLDAMAEGYDRWFQRSAQEYFA